MTTTLPLLLLSFRHRNSLSAALAGQEQTVVAVRRPETLDRHMDSQMFGAILVDARDAVVDALSAVERIAQFRPDYSPQTHILLSAEDEDFCDAFILCGILKTHVTIMHRGDAVKIPESLEIGKTLALSTAHKKLPDTYGLSRAQRNAVFRGDAAILLGEITDLARVNDRHGRASGDMLLHIVTRRIDRILRTEGASASHLIDLGGARFALLSTVPLSPEQRELSALALLSHLATPYAIHQYAVQPHIRISMANARSGDSIATLLRRAALARPIKAAQTGRNIIPDAIASGQISVLYQPQYRSEDDAICGVEALARWQAPDGSEAGAAALVAAAVSEQHGAMLGDHMRAMILHDMAKWRGDAAQISVAINVLPDEFCVDSFAPNLLRIMAQNGVSPSRITIEITEHSLLDMAASTVEGLETLRSAGVRIALDDFGTGFSSLAYLKNLPVDILKIDAGFSRDAMGSPRERAILGTIVQLARTLDLKVVAEGIESETQLALLRDMGIDHYQGYLRSRAVSAQDIQAMLPMRGSADQLGQPL